MKVDCEVCGAVYEDTDAHDCPVIDGPRDKLPLYEAGTREPRAWLNNEGHITPAGPHPKIMFADIPIMVHLTNGHSVAPYHDEDDTGPNV